MGRPARRQRWPSLGALIAGLAALAASAIAPVPAAAAPDQASPPPSYVALGDSYTSGPLIPDQLPDPLGCLRSDRNYPHLVAPATGIPGFRDVSCAGAETDHMFAAQGVVPGPNPPQLDALDANTALVTLGIGGNDIGVAEIVFECATLWPFGSPCRDRFVTGGVDQISARIAAAAPEVAAVLDAVDARSPQARVLVVGYPAILPDTGFGCWPSVPLAFGDVGYLRAKQKELNAMLAAQATAHGATFVDTYTPSIGHDACTPPSVRWIEPAIPATIALSIHPNARGMAGMAAAVTAHL